MARVPATSPTSRVAGQAREAREAREVREAPEVREARAALRKPPAALSDPHEILAAADLLFRLRHSAAESATVTAGRGQRGLARRLRAHLHRRLDAAAPAGPLAPLLGRCGLTRLERELVLALAADALGLGGSSIAGRVFLVQLQERLGLSPRARLHVPRLLGPASRLVRRGLVFVEVGDLPVEDEIRLGTSLLEGLVGGAPDEAWDACDNCAAISNASQADPDDDGHGSACDNGPSLANEVQLDDDANGVGRQCANSSLGATFGSPGLLRALSCRCQRQEARLGWACLAGRRTGVAGPEPVQRCTLRTMIRAEDLVGEEWAEWYRLTPAQRWAESLRLWDAWLLLGGSLDPEPDTQSPFFDAGAPSARPAHGRPSLRVVRRSGV